MCSLNLSPNDCKVVKSSGTKVPDTADCQFYWQSQKILVNKTHKASSIVTMRGQDIMRKVYLQWNKDKRKHHRRRERTSKTNILIYICKLLHEHLCIHEIESWHHPLTHVIQPIMTVLLKNLFTVHFQFDLLKLETNNTRDDELKHAWIIARWTAGWWDLSLTTVATSWVE